MYYPRELRVLDIFTSEAGVAIQNAKSYAAIKRFSGELEKRVEERTQELKATQARELEKAQAVTKLKDEFVFIAAHELRTPVTIIRGFLDLIEMSEERFSQNVRENLSKIKMASVHLNQLVNDLLEIARSDAGTLQVQVTQMALGPLVIEVVDEVRLLAQEKDITVQVDVPEQLPQVMADRDKTKEVIMNLVSNAIKYNRPRGDVHVIVSRQETSIVVAVRDTGYGIPATEQTKIFQKFFRAVTPATKQIMGSGLGLFICRMLIERMGGQIKFSSVEGVGSTFSFTLPVA
jgi:signal transduction histidine kinase